MKALNSYLAFQLWEWCENEVKQYTQADEDVKAKGDIIIEEDTRRRLEEVTKAEEVTKLKEDVQADEATKTKEAMEAK